MSAPKTPLREETSHGLPPPAERAFPISPAVAKALVAVAGLWTLGMAAIALAARVGVDGFPQGWRLILLQAGSVVGFIALVVAGVAAIIAIERRRAP